MFGILFGWRRASKCKKLIRRVQCRLKLLKNKRCSIVRQLRDDVAQLIRYGHEQSAFDRVEQLFKDESIVAVYDLLDHFCEFIIIHLSYIRKHKDCPNDINEAVSTLIFASSRCGDLPELPVIRKLFGERYGQRFAMVALDLLPGNLVNHQIKENLSIKSVPDDVKYRLVDEIASSCLQPGPLAIEYYSELQLEQKNKILGDQVLRGEDAQVQGFDVMEAEGKIVHVDVTIDSKKLSIEPCYSHHVVKFTDMNSPDEFRIAGPGTEISSPECLSPLPKEMIYLDDIEEFKSHLSKGQSFQDQRLFLFKSSVILATENLQNGFAEKNESRNEKIGSRSSTKSRKASGKRQRRSGFEEGTSVKDVESTIYYEKSRKSNPQRNHRKKFLFDETHECSLEYPCYFCMSDDKDERGSQKRKTTTLEGFPVHNLTEEIKKSGKHDSLYSHPSYLRAMTMPPERPSDDCGADHNMLRSNSYPFQQPSHVHPKLPDYDQLAAKFMALKKANLQ